MKNYIWKLFTDFVERISRTHTFHAHFSLLFTIWAMALATGISSIYHHVNPTGSANVALIYILTIIMISYHTDKYRYGIISGIVSVFFINYLFTYPFGQFSFAVSGYPFTFMVMYFISILTSATTFRMKDQARKINEAEKFLAEAEKEKLRANLLRAVSHDLRTPLTSMIGASSSYLENEAALPPEEKRKLVSEIYEDANWLLNMVENLLTVTRIRNDSASVNKSLEPVEEVMSEAVFRLKKRIPDANIRVLLPEEFVMIPMDATLIEQVMVNLMENAVFHAGSTEPIECRAEIGRDTVTFFVTDQGVGIDEDKLETIFDGTGQTENSSADGHKGMGIGLSICKTIIVAHGGTISARNLERGAQFGFTLPRGEANED